MRRLSWPVVSIGNLSTGGSGKTPFAIALAQLLAAKGFHVDVLSRGYGRDGHLPARVRSDGTAEEFGDEPLMIVRETGLPVYVAPRRWEAGRLAEADRSASASEQQDSSRSQASAAHVLDDGFQHRQLHRDVDILLLNQADWCDSLLPAGNLREALPAARRADVLAIQAGEPEFEAKIRAWNWGGRVWRLHRRMDVPAIERPVIAFCGIARPEQFFSGLEDAGLRLASRVIFGDHHRYTLRDVESLQRAARAIGAEALITTEKDHARLGNLAAACSAELPLKTARLRIQIEDESESMGWLISQLSR
jgi:tetraacyldisaccharide 4'-kinase